MQEQTAQTSPLPKANGHAKRRLLRIIGAVERRRIAKFYQKHGRKLTIERFSLADSVLYPILHAAGVRMRAAGKGRRQPTGKRRPVGKGRRIAAPRASYDASWDAARAAYSRAGAANRRGAAIDALTYLGKARERAIRQAAEGIPGAASVLGLIGLAIEALGGD